MPKSADDDNNNDSGSSGGDLSKCHFQRMPKLWSKEMKEITWTLLVYYIAILTDAKVLPAMTLLKPH